MQYKIMSRIVAHFFLQNWPMCGGWDVQILELILKTLFQDLCSTGRNILSCNTTVKYLLGFDKK